MLTVDHIKEIMTLEEIQEILNSDVLMDEEIRECLVSENDMRVKENKRNQEIERFIEKQRKAIFRLES